MLTKENAGFYPPRINVFFASTPTDTTPSGGRIEFKGAEERLTYDIFWLQVRKQNYNGDFFLRCERLCTQKAIGTWSK